MSIPPFLVQNSKGRGYRGRAKMEERPTASTRRSWEIYGRYRWLLFSTVVILASGTQALFPSRNCLPPWKCSTNPPNTNWVRARYTSGILDGGGNYGFACNAASAFEDAKNALQPQVLKRKQDKLLRVSAACVCKFPEPATKPTNGIAVSHVHPPLIS